MNSTKIVMNCWRGGGGMPSLLIFLHFSGNRMIPGASYQLAQGRQYFPIQTQEEYFQIKFHRFHPYFPNPILIEIIKNITKSFMAKL